MDPKLQQYLAVALIGIIAGWLASILVGGPHSLIGYLLSGVIGAFVGSWVLGKLGLNLGIRNSFASEVVTATIGAVIVVILARIML